MQFAASLFPMAFVRSALDIEDMSIRSVTLADRSVLLTVAVQLADKTYVSLYPEATSKLSNLLVPAALAHGQRSGTEDPMRAEIGRGMHPSDSTSRLF